MTRIEARIAPGSIGGLAAGFMATQLFLAPAGDHRGVRVAPLLNYKLSPSTYGEHASFFTGAGPVAPAVAAPSIESFYTGLLSGQERLGREFEQVLFENLWELYAR
jgi:hypothetical protein